MAEVQVFSGKKNVALQGSASQSSTSLGAIADRAIDGKTDGSWGGDSVSHTNYQADPWWEVDLGAEQPITRIVIFNRTDGELAQRLSDCRVTLLDDARQVVWQQQIAEPPDPKLVLDLSPARLDFVQPRLEWAVSDRTLGTSSNSRQVAILQTRQLVGYPQGTVFQVTLKGRRQKQPESAAAVRFSVTTAEPPLFDIPPEIDQIMETPAAERTAEQIDAVAAFFRTIAPGLEPVRQRLQQLRNQFDHVK